MLAITVGAIESWDYDKNEFTSSGGVVVALEHSLVSLSKWESKYEKAFLSDKEISTEETLAYIGDMLISPAYAGWLDHLTDENVEEVNDYLNRKQTATWFRESRGGGRSRETITAELIYYWMFQNQIPMECQYWHINRLFTLLKVCNAKSAPPKKISRAEALAERRKLNDQRRQQLGTRG